MAGSLISGYCAIPGVTDKRAAAAGWRAVPTAWIIHQHRHGRVLSAVCVCVCVCECVCVCVCVCVCPCVRCLRVFVGALM